MAGNHDVNLIAQELKRVSPDISTAVAVDEKDEGRQKFIFSAKRVLTTDEVVAICRDMATVIRREIPERPDGWAASIHVRQYGADMMGVYFIGWTGRTDQWRLFEGQEWKATDPDEWRALTERLRAGLAALGTERHPGDHGDFHMEGKPASQREQAVYVHRPEFLTKQLIDSIRTALMDSPADWSVEVTLDFPPPLEKLFRGVVVRADGITEKWKRQQVEKALGKSVKDLVS